MAKYRMATLFSGAGGLDTAFEESKKFDLVFANDVLSAPAESYSKNFSHKIVDASEFGKGTELPAYVVGDVTRYRLFSNRKGGLHDWRTAVPGLFNYKGRQGVRN